MGARRRTPCVTRASRYSNGYAPQTAQGPAHRRCRRRDRHFGQVLPRPAAPTSSSSTTPGATAWPGHGSLSGLLSFGDANQIVYEMGEREVLPIVNEVPVIAGVNGTDPLRQMPHFLRQLDDLGFSGINNFPTVGLIDGRFRAELEATNSRFLPGSGDDPHCPRHRLLHHRLRLHPRRRASRWPALAPIASSRTWA